MNKKIIKQIFPQAVIDVENGQCPFCRKKINIEDFTDSLSLREFRISGICNSCQNKVFK